MLSGAFVPVLVFRTTRVCLWTDVRSWLEENGKTLRRR